MPTEHILALLIEERDKLNRAIEALQGPMKRRGRPPLSAARPTATPVGAAESAHPAKKKRRTFTAAQRKQQAERMKAFWAAKKKAAAKPESTAANKRKSKAAKAA
jgi:hypothetical protein